MSCFALFKTLSPRAQESWCQVHCANGYKWLLVTQSSLTAFLVVSSRSWWMLVAAQAGLSRWKHQSFIAARHWRGGTQRQPTAFYHLTCLLHYPPCYPINHQGNTFQPVNCQLSTVTFQLITYHIINWAQHQPWLAFSTAPPCRPASNYQLITRTTLALAPINLSIFHFSPVNLLNFHMSTVKSVPVNLSTYDLSISSECQTANIEVKYISNEEPALL